MMVTFLARISHIYFFELHPVEEFFLLLSVANAASDLIDYPLIIKSDIRD